MLGAEGVVSQYYEPSEDCSRWLLFVELPYPDGHEDSMLDGQPVTLAAVLAEDDLESTGFQAGGDGSRQPLDPTPPSELRDELQLSLMLFPEQIRGRAAARGFADALLPRIRALVELDEISYSVAYERLGTLPTAQIGFRLAPVGSGFAAFQALGACVDSGWYSSDDDGWRCELYWSQEYANEGTVFLAPEVDSAVIQLEPWTSLARRPASERLPEVHEPRFDEELAEIAARSSELSLEYGPGLYLTDPADFATTEASLRCTECGRDPRRARTPLSNGPATPSFCRSAPSAQRLRSPAPAPDSSAWFSGRARRAQPRSR